MFSTALIRTASTANPHGAMDAITSPRFMPPDGMTVVPLLDGHIVKRKREESQDPDGSIHQHNSNHESPPHTKKQKKSDSPVESDEFRTSQPTPLDQLSTSSTASSGQQSEESHDLSEHQALSNTLHNGQALSQLDDSPDQDSTTQESACLPQDLVNASSNSTKVDLIRAAYQKAVDHLESDLFHTASSLRNITVDLQIMGFGTPDSSPYEIIASLQDIFSKIRADLSEIFPHDTIDDLSDCDMLHHFADYLIKQYEELRRLLDELQASKLARESLSREHTQEVESFKARIADLFQDLGQLQSAYESLNSEVEQGKLDHRERHVKYNDNVTDLLETISKLETESRQSRSELSHKDQTIDTLRNTQLNLLRQTNDQTQHIESIHRQIGELHREYIRLNSRTQDSKDAQRTTAACPNQAEASVAQIKEQDGPDIFDNREDAGRLEKALLASRNHIDSIRSYNVATEAKHQEYVAQVRKLRADLAQQEERQQQSENALNAELSSVKMQLGTERRRYASANQSVRDRDCRIGELEKELKFCRDSTKEAGLNSAALRHEVASLEEARSALLEMVRTLTEANDVLRSQATEHDFTNRSLNTEVTQLRDKVEFYSRKVIKREEELEELSAEHTSTVQASEEELSQMRRQSLSDARALEDCSAEAERLSSEAEATIKVRDQELSRLRSEVDKQSQRLTACMTETNEMSSKHKVSIEQCNGQISKLQAEVASRSRELAARDNEMSTLSEAHVLAVKEYNGQVTALRGQVDRQSQELAATTSDMAKLSTKYQRKVNDQDAEIERLRIEIARQSRELTIRGTEQKDLSDKYESEIRDREHEIVRLRTNMDTKSQERTSCNSDVQQRSAKYEETIKHHEEALKQLHEQIDLQLDTSSTERKTLVADLTHATKTIKLKDEALRDLTDQIVRADNGALSKDKRLARLSASNTELMEINASLEARVEALKIRVRRHQADTQSLQSLKAVEAVSTRVESENEAQNDAELEARMEGNEALHADNVYLSVKHGYLLDLVHSFLRDRRGTRSDAADENEDEQLRDELDEIYERNKIMGYDNITIKVERRDDTLVDEDSMSGEPSLRKKRKGRKSSKAMRDSAIIMDSDSSWS